MTTRTSLVGEAGEFPVGAVEQHRNHEQPGPPGKPDRVADRAQPGRGDAHGEAQAGEMVGVHGCVNQRADTDPDDAVNPGIMAHDGEA